VRILVNDQKAGDWTVRHSDFVRESLILAPDLFQNQDRGSSFETRRGFLRPRSGQGRVDCRCPALADPVGSGPIGFYKWGDTWSLALKVTAWSADGWLERSGSGHQLERRPYELALPTLPPKARSCRAACETVPGPWQGGQTAFRILSTDRRPERRHCEADFQDIAVDIPANLFGNSGAIALTLETPDAVSPKQIGAGTDQRRLGIAVKSLRLRIK
jgi:hypothetical protein